MASSLSLLSSLLFFQLATALALFPSPSKIQPLCHEDERNHLLEFKQSLVIDKHASTDPLAYSKVESWMVEGEQITDCCSWDGVECDKATGYVIGLNLSSSYLYGSINSSSNLFHLAQLQRLNLADNDFNDSEIPSRLGNLLKLTSLNLSTCSFSGEIPSTISLLSELSVLDLSWNDELILKEKDFRNIVQNLTSLEFLHLNLVDISSIVPATLANLSSLKTLHLSNCGLYGEFPTAIFLLPYLQILRLSFNEALHGHLPEFNFSSPLQSLTLTSTNFSGELPASIGNLASLKVFSIVDSSFSGRVPTSLGNLTQLEFLGFSDNNFQIQNPSSLSWVGKLSNLTDLHLNSVSLNGEIPAYVANLTKLQLMEIKSCQITKIPDWISNMTQLRRLLLSDNALQGPIPGSIFQLKNLETLILDKNQLSGVVELSMFLELKKLSELSLSTNQLSLLDKSNTNTTFPKFRWLSFRSCNLSQFPHFLSDQDELQYLDLANNRILGLIPRWMWNNTAKDTLLHIDLSNNLLTGFQDHPSQLAWNQLMFVDLSSNRLQGTLPMPPPSTITYSVADNNLTGEMPSDLCSLSSIYSLDLSGNNFSGNLPQCLGNLRTLQLLNLRRNNFIGEIPEIQQDKCILRMLAMDYNQLEGQLPQSLAKCVKLEFLVLGNNHINDVFPSWLGAIPELEVLILSSNRFHGPVQEYKTSFDFPKLRVIDLSQNNFSGKLPMNYLLNWSAMRVGDAEQSMYMEASKSYMYGGHNSTMTGYVEYSMSMTIKGMEREYAKVLGIFKAIDLSSNSFEGDIPEGIGSLTGLVSLNLSNNILSGQVPASLGNLSVLESLDLSANNLSGEIPQQLSQLNFLAVFNVSHNLLTGPIPLGKQFNTFQNDSYMGNSGLCGSPLTKECGISEALPPSDSSSEEDQDSGSSFLFGWKPVAIGYACGTVVGMVIGHIVATRNYGWFLRTFRLRSQRVQRVGVGARRS